MTYSAKFPHTAFAAVLLAGAEILMPQRASARDLLGVFGSWAAFRDSAVPRCYAIAKPERTLPGTTAWADVGTWPAKNLRGVVHIHLPRPLAANATVTLTIAGQHLHLAADAAEAWATDRRMDAAIVAAMRSAPGFTVTARLANGRLVVLVFPLAGAASAMDAALVACAR